MQRLPHKTEIDVARHRIDYALCSPAHAQRPPLPGDRYLDSLTHLLEVIHLIFQLIERLFHS